MLVSLICRTPTHGTPATKVDTVGSQHALADSTQGQQPQATNDSENFIPPLKLKTHSVNTNRPSYSFNKASSSREALTVVRSRSTSHSASPKKKPSSLKPTTFTSSTPKTVVQEVSSESHKKAHIEALSRSTMFQSKSSLTPHSVEFFNNTPNSPLHALTFTTPTQANTSTSNIHSSREFTPNITPTIHSLPAHAKTGDMNESQPWRSAKQAMPIITETEDEPAVMQRLGME